MGFMQEWFDFTTIDNKISERKFLTSYVYCSEWFNKMHKKPGVKRDSLRNSTFSIEYDYDKDFFSCTDFRKVRKQMYKDSAILNAEKNYLRKIVNDKYGNNWFKLSHCLEKSLSKLPNQKISIGDYSIPAEVINKLQDKFRRVTKTENGKEIFIDCLYCCVYEFAFQKLPIEMQKEKDEYISYLNTLHKFGVFSVSSQYLIWNFAQQGNCFAKYDLAQMYYYGTGIITERNYNKTYEIYEDLNNSGYRDPLFLWSRSDFIINYFDAKEKKLNNRIIIDSLENMSENEKIDTLNTVIWDLLEAEEEDGDSAANLLGNILTGKSLILTGNWKASLIKQITKYGNSDQHYAKAAKLDNPYACYHLFYIYIKKSIQCAYESQEVVLELIREAYENLKRSAELGNIRSVNEMALINIYGLKNRLTAYVKEQNPSPEQETSLSEAISQFATNEYNENTDSDNLLCAYKHLKSIYDFSVEVSEFKWPVNNMIEHIYLNPKFDEAVKKSSISHTEKMLIMEEKNNTQKHINVIQSVLSNDVFLNNPKNEKLISALKNNLTNLQQKYTSNTKG